MKLLTSSILLIFITTASLAETVSCNPNGAVVTRDYGTVFYLGKDCDAAIKDGGTGYWMNAANFIGVHIGKSAKDSQGYQIFSEISCLGFCTLPDGFFEE